MNRKRGVIFGGELRKVHRRFLSGRENSTRAGGRKSSERGRLPGRSLKRSQFREDARVTPRYCRRVEANFFARDNQQGPLGGYTDEEGREKTHAGRGAFIEGEARTIGDVVGEGHQGANSTASGTMERGGNKYRLVGNGPNVFEEEKSSVDLKNHGGSH